MCAACAREKKTNVTYRTRYWCVCVSLCVYVVCVCVYKHHRDSRETDISIVFLKVHAQTQTRTDRYRVVWAVSDPVGGGLQSQNCQGNGCCAPAPPAVEIGAEGRGQTQGHTNRADSSSPRRLRRPFTVIAFQTPFTPVVVSRRLRVLYFRFRDRRVTVNVPACSIRSTHTYNEKWINTIMAKKKSKTLFSIFSL